MHCLCYAGENCVEMHSSHDKKYSTLIFGSVALL